MFGSAVKTLAAAAILATTASAANAAVVVDTVGQSFSITYSGMVGGTATSDIGAFQTFTLDSISDGGLTYNFSYSLENTSAYSSRLRSFGFNVIDTDLASTVGTGAYAFGGMGDTFPEGVGKLDACFAATGNGGCTGGPQGLTAGATGTGTFSLTFAAPVTSLELDDFTTRFQSISPSIGGENSGVGIGAAVPETATWAMMIVGLGMAGAGLRSSRRRAEMNTRYSFAA